jgi:ubiquinone/menaquinone biosynthesis C-methylase UbiE
MLKENNHAVKVKAKFDEVDDYVAGNSSLMVRRAIVKELVSELQFQSYLEVGCGDGSIALSISKTGRKLFLVDFSEKMIERARENAALLEDLNVDFEVCDILTFEPSERFDLIICIGVLAHVSSVDGLILKLSNLLKDTGYLIVQFTDSSSVLGRRIGQYTRVSADGYQVNMISEKNIFQIFKKYGFCVLNNCSYSDSAAGLSKLSLRFAYYLKLISYKLNWPSIFSEKIILFRRVSPD